MAVIGEGFRSTRKAALDRLAEAIEHVSSGVGMVERFDDEWLAGGRRRIIIEYSVPVTFGDD